MSNYLTPGLLQLYSKGIEDLNITDEPSITFFKYAYKNIGLFYKDDTIVENIKIKWNDNYFFKIPNDINYLGPMWLKVTIPNFQTIESTTTSTTTVTNNGLLNEIIYDGQSSYLIIINSAVGLLYYLIPITFFSSQFKLQLIELNFNDIKQYFNSITVNSIMNDTTIQMAVFSNNNPTYTCNDIIPLLYSQTSSFTQLILHYLVNSDEYSLIPIYSKNLLTQSSFDIYIKNLINNILIKEYNDINKFDSIPPLDYDVINQEIDYYYNHYLNNIPPDTTQAKLDLGKTLVYCNDNINIIDTSTVLKSTINTNALILQSILLNLNPASPNNFTFYKKFTVLKDTSHVTITLNQSNIIDVNNTFSTNLVARYYPTYTVNVTLFNLPFDLASTMTFVTLDGKIAQYTITNNISQITITDTPNSTTVLTSLPIIVSTNNNTKNVINNNINNTDTNINTEWANNFNSIISSNINNENYLLNDFKLSYFLKENTISNSFNIINNSNITNLWIELKTIVDRFNKKNTPIGFNITGSTDTFSENKKIVENNYSIYLNIQSIPLDLCNLYAVALNNFIYSSINKYFYDDTLLLFFYNKINGYLYERFNRISNLSSTSILNFKGLVFYYNINLKEYITQNCIYNFLTEILNMSTFICYIPINNMTPLNLRLNNIVDYQNDMNQYGPFYNNNNCFHELKTVTEFTDIIYTIDNNDIIIDISINNIILPNDIITFDISNNNIIYRISQYDINKNILTLNNIVDQIDTKYNLNLNIITKHSIPLLNISETGSANDFTKVTIYSKSKSINLFESYNKINIVLTQYSYIIISYGSNSTKVVLAKYDSTLNILVSDLLDRYYIEYDTITATIINLPCTYLTINDNDCNASISSSYPYIYILKTSTVYINNSSLFTHINTINSNDINIRIMSETDTIITLYCYDSNVFNKSSIDINIMNNSYLPNFYQYTSLNPNVSTTVDYMMQKPLLIQLNNSSNLPIYCIANIVKNKNSTLYLDEKQIFILYNMNGDQLIRNSILNKLYSSHYYNGLLLYQSDVDTIKDSIYLNYFSSYNQFIDIVSIIESGIDEYAKSYIDTIDNINIVEKYGSTINSVYHTCIPFNTLYYSTNISSYQIIPTNYSLSNYDIYTIFAISLFNFTNVNLQNITKDDNIIVVLTNKINNMIVNSPWQNYNPSFKLSNKILNYLSNYSIYALRQLDYVDRNTTLLSITNSSNFPQDFSTENILRFKYENLVYNINYTKLYLKYTNPWTLYLQNTLEDDISILWNLDSTNQIINVNTSNELYSNESIAPFIDSPTYTETILETFESSQFKLIGAIKVQDGKIVLPSTTVFTSTKYIVIDNNIIIDTTLQKQSYIYTGINYKSYSLELKDSTNYTFSQLNQPFYYYKITMSNLKDYFNTNVKYLVNFKNNINGYMKYIEMGDGYLILLLNNKIILENNTTMFYSITSLSDSDIFNYINSNFFSDNFTNIYKFIFINFTIDIVNTYNIFQERNTFTLNEFLIFENNILLNQYYSDYIYLLGRLMLQYNGTTTNSIILTLYETTSTLLPPLYITKYNVTIFDPLQDINWLQYKDYWLKIENNIFQIKNFTNILNLDNDNYLLYYYNKSNYPIIKKNSDIFYEKIEILNAEYNPYQNCFTFNEDTIYPNNFTAISNYISSNINQYIANNNQIDSININIYLNPQNTNIETNIILQDNNGILYRRPLIITNTIFSINYNLFDIGNNLIDNFIVLPINTNVDSVFIAKIVLTTLNITLTSNSNLISIIAESPTVYNVYAINTINILNSVSHMIIINSSNNLYFNIWLYIGDYPTFNLISPLPIIEPFYINYLTEQTIYSDNNLITFNFTDIKFFTNNNTNITTITNNVADSIIISSDLYSSFDTIFNNNNIMPVDTIVQEDTNITGCMQNWLYIDNVSIINNTITSTNLAQFTHYILVDTDILNYNINSNITDTNKIKLEYATTSLTADVFVYPFSPIFIKCDIYIINTNTTMLIYTKNNILQKNEMIKIGTMMVLIDRYSLFYNAFVGKILSPIDVMPNILQGYYSFGKWSNYYERNTMLNNINLNNIFKGGKSTIFINELTYGDYYIDMSILSIYKNNTTSEYIFKLDKGTEIELYYNNNTWYYDEKKVYIKANMCIIFYIDSIYYEMVVDNVNSGIIEFKLTNIGINFVTKNIYTCYLPIQPFETINITVTNNIITNFNNINGFIEIYINSSINIYKVSNSIVDSSNLSGNYVARFINVDKMSINHDFSSYYTLFNLEDPNISNKSLALNIIANLNIEDGEYYFTNNIGYNFTNLYYCYLQYILINLNWYRVKSITSTRIYIEYNSNLNTNLESYSIIFSVGDINWTNLISNEYLIENTYTLTYPMIEYNSTNNLVRLLSSSTNNISLVIDDLSITSISSDFTQFEYNINSPKLNEYNSNLENNMSISYYYENYIPVIINDNIINNIIMTPNKLTIEVGTNILLHEITSNNEMYSHYINIILINNLFKISSLNDFHDINKSKFYLHCIIPVVITENKYLILLNPVFKVTTPLYLFKRNTITATVNIKTSIISKPIKINNNWQYIINLTEEKFGYLENNNLYYNNKPCSVIKSINTYYLLTNELIINEPFSFIYFKQKNYLEKIVCTNKTIKSEYNNLDTNIFNKISGDELDTIKIVNQVYTEKNVSNNNYIITIKNNLNLPVTFNNLDGINYIGESNLIESNSIYNNSYLITSQYELTDLATSPILYNLSKLYVHTNIYRKVQREISPSLPIFECNIFINISNQLAPLIVNQMKPWSDWSLISTRYNFNLENYLIKNSIKFDGSIFSSIESSSYFTPNEEFYIKSFITNLYQNNILQQYKLDILNDLYLLEQYLLNELKLYLTQNYFWNNINIIMKQIVENFQSVYNWTLYSPNPNQNIIIIQESNVLEIDLYPSNFIIKYINNEIYYTRSNYISIDFTIESMLNTIIISRDPTIIDNELTNVINLTLNETLNGTSMDNIIGTINTMSKDKNNIITTNYINLQYMSSLQYYIIKSYDEIKNKLNGNKLNELTYLNRTISNSQPNKYSGKYYDYLFNEVYFGLTSQSKYILNTTNTSLPNTIYVDPYLNQKLYIYKNVSNYTNPVNILSTNNIFSYNILFNSNMAKTTEIINSNNIYTIDILDNYSHTIVPVINQNQYNTDSISFYSDKLITPIDVSLKVKSQYNILNIITYGLIYIVTLDGSISKDDVIYFDDMRILYLDTNIINTYEYKIASINLNKSNNKILNVTISTIIQKFYVQNNYTYLTFANNITTNSNELYISIDDIIYKLYPNLNNSSNYYITSIVNISTTQLYNVIRFVTILNIENTNTWVNDIYIDIDIDPLDYIQTDPKLPSNFSILNLNNTINNSIINILTLTTLRVQYNNLTEINTTNNNILYNNYYYMQSIPYQITSVVKQNKYFYEMSNISNIRLEDSIVFINNDIIYNATIYSIVNNIITFYLLENILTTELNTMILQITKEYILTVKLITENYIITEYPNENVFYNYNYSYTVDNINVIVEIMQNNLKIITPFELNPSIYITLQQQLNINIPNVSNLINSNLYQIKTKFSSGVISPSNIYIPILQTMQPNLIEFPYIYYYKFTSILNIIDTIIFVEENNILIDSFIVMNQINGNKYDIIIGINTLIEPQYIKIYTRDMKNNDMVYLSFTSYIYQKGTLLKQYEDNITYDILYSNDSLYEYNINNNITNNIVILSFKYSDITVTNNSYKNIGFNKVEDTITVKKNTTSITKNIEWVNELPIKLFNSIQLLVDENILEKLDYDTYILYNNYLSNIWQRKEFEKMGKIRYNPINNNMYFFLPLKFNFTIAPESYLPINKMKKSNIKIKFNISKLEDMCINITSGSKFTKNITPFIDIHYEYIINNNINTNTNINKDTNIEYLLYTPLYSYQSFTLNNLIEAKNINLYNRTTDLFLIIKNNNGKQISTIYDSWYNEYLENNIIDFNIFEIIDEEIKINSKRYSILNLHPIISKYNIRFAMYLDEKYLGYIPENLNNSDLKFSNKLTILILYFTKIYNNTPVYNNNIVNNINIQLNGIDLLPLLPSSYYNNTIPYMRGYSLPNGYFMYSFNYNSLTSQPNGMLNLKYIKDLQIYLTLNFLNKNLQLKICTREYKIIKIEKSIGTLL